jgi:hypothetical protein
MALARIERRRHGGVGGVGEISLIKHEMAASASGVSA